MQELMPGDPAAIGPYRLTGRLGEGGMGQVFLGVSRSGRRLAVKVIRPQIAADPGFRERFRREVAAARSVGGFWTAPIVDADPDSAMPWVASDYIEAPDLGRLVLDEGPLDERALRSLAAGLAEALEAVHRTGLVHRDLKPSNILVTGDGPRVIDFGISKAAEGATTLTDTGLVVGTPGFMSPEQASGARVGPESDVFSLGAVLAFAASGDGPFGVGSVPALLYRVVHDKPRLDGVPEGLLGVVAACLEKEPGRRPSATELLDLLSGARASEPRPDARRAAVAPTAPVTEVDDAADVPDEFELRTGVLRRAGKGTSFGTGLIVGGVLLVFPGTLVAALAVDSAMFLMVLVGGLLLMGVGLLVVKRQPPVERFVTLSPEGVRCRVGELEWWADWDDVERITLKPPKKMAGSESQWSLSAVLWPGTAVPPAFVEGVAAGNRAGMPLAFTEQDDVRGGLRRLDEALRHYADGLYERHDALADLLDGPRR
ncbi:serine/threonine-protein kinase [Streptomyces sp. NPDC058579]|uniref:serine/threonine-protein kinase n=1 Tax=Streptomyces sp. NPDC058579 TaxID=3346548 RepID=UPI00364AD5E7